MLTFDKIIRGTQICLIRTFLFTSSECRAFESTIHIPTNFLWDKILHCNVTKDTFTVAEIGFHMFQNPGKQKKSDIEQIPRQTIFLIFNSNQ